MKQKLISLRNLAQRNAAKMTVGALSLVGGAAMAQSTDPADPTAAITQAKTTILALVGVGGVAMVAIALAMVGWRVGAKFVGRLGAKS